MFSSASLEAVKFAAVFLQEGSTLCRGVLFEYDNGAQRAVGECRIGVQASTTYATPSVLCVFGEPELASEAVTVEFAKSDHHHEDAGGWDCYPMSGVLNFWFTYNQTYLDFKPSTVH
jgi:hypothetical protein